MTQTRLASIFRIIFLTTILLLLAVSTASAQVVASIVATDVDASEFPNVTVAFRATEDNGAPAGDLSGLTVTENGTAIDGLAIGTIAAGVEVIFAIDANESIGERDGDPQSRREKVRDVLNLYADNYIAEGPDLVSVVVPVDDEHPNGELLRDGIFINELKNAANFYEPDFAGSIDVEALLNKALAVAAENQADGRSQQIVLFSDGALEDITVDFDAIVAQANSQNVAISAAILGARADDNEIVNMEALAVPTGGSWVHMPQVDDVEPILDQATAQREQNQVTYRSQANSSGSQTVALGLGGASVEATFDVTVEPAGVTILLDDSNPIIRVTNDAEAELATIEPTSQAVLAQINWPDDHPRNIVSVALVVDGVIQQAIDNPSLGDNNTLDLSWDISNLDANTYNLSIEVTDELGIEGSSAPLPLVIEVQRPQLIEATEAAPTGETTDGEAVVETESTDEGFSLDTLTSSIWFWVGVAAIALFLVFLFFSILIAILRRRGKNDEEPDPQLMVQPQATLDADATQILAPAFVQRSSAAYLEPLENASEHVGIVPLSGNNVAMGRDPKLAQIIFKDKSVSRLHARIMESNGEYRLYDEGSASGTYHNYERVGLTPQTLKDNDELHLGRVHLRFRMSGATQDNDATQVFGPAAGDPPQPPPQQNLDDMSTQPFLPHGPGGGPPAGGPSGPAPGGPSDNDPDGTSTQPYMPHKPNR